MKSIAIFNSGDEWYSSSEISLVFWEDDLTFDQFTERYNDGDYLDAARDDIARGRATSVQLCEIVRFYEKFILGVNSVNLKSSK